MKRNYFVMATIFFQLLTGIFHSLSFFAEQKPANETEQKVMDAISLKMDMGAGIHRSFAELFIAVSVCLTLLCLLAGAINWLLLKRKTDAPTMKGIMLINTMVFGIALMVILKFAFLPPMICIGLIFMGSLFSWISIKK